MRWLVLFGLLACVSGAHAEWSEVLADDGSAISVAEANDDLQVVAQNCTFSDGNCRWVVMTDDMCVPGETQTPALLSGPEGTAPITLHCLSSYQSGGKRYYRLGMAPFDDVDRVLRLTGAVGIAFPLKSGQFRVVRFRLSGNVEAIDGMRAKALRRAQGSTKAQTL